MRESEPSRAQSVPDSPKATHAPSVNLGDHKGGFTGIPNRMAQDPRLESKRLHVIGYANAVGYFAGNWTTRISQPDSMIAKRAGLGITAFREVEKLLIECGYIRKHSIDKALDPTGRQIEIMWLVSTECTEGVEIEPVQRARRGRPPKQKVSVPQTETFEKVSSPGEDTFQKVSSPHNETFGKVSSPHDEPLIARRRDFRRNSLPDKEVSDPLKIKIRSAAARCSPLPPIQSPEDQTKTPQGLTPDQSAALDAMRDKISRSRHSQYESSLMELLQGAILGGSDPEGLQCVLDERVLKPDVKNPPGLLRTILETEGPIKAPPRPETAHAKPFNDTVSPEFLAMHNKLKWGVKRQSIDGRRP